MLGFGGTTVDGVELPVWPSLLASSGPLLEFAPQTRVHGGEGARRDPLLALAVA